MGQEISTCRFERRDFHRFERRLASEMALMHEYFRAARFSERTPRIGIELEAWLVDQNSCPQPRNGEFLQALDSPLVVPELAQFNIEFNVSPQTLSGMAFRSMENELAETLRAADQTARDMDLRIATIGILPTIHERDLSLKSMSESARYRALNEQVLRLRRDRPIRLDIEGQESLHIEHKDVMLESAATSLQVHYQVPCTQSVRYYNAALIASGPVIAATANSPWLFGRQLWCETRIPLFEQAVDIGGPFPRVHFGAGYALDSLEEFFLENRSFHPVLLPMELDEPVEALAHVRLHNGTIWRWNRPLIGFDDSGEPHLRIEHRVMPAGPTVPDMLANIALATGLVQWLAIRPEAPEVNLPWGTAAANFEQGARFGLSAELTWLDGRQSSAHELLLEALLPLAEAGLNDLRIHSADISRFLGIISDRVRSGRNGAAWQIEFARRHGRNMRTLTQAYLDCQQSGRPVHEWDL